MKLSIVGTLYLSTSTICEFIQRAAKSAREVVGDDFEIVLVDDGSPDDSAILVEQLLSTYPQLRLVRLSRNFGHHRALLAGLDFAQGDRVLLIDTDLEECPEWLVEFWEVMDGTGAEVVFGTQEQRRD